MKLSGDNKVELIDYQPKAATFYDDVRNGLSQPQKKIPAKYFYDEKGSEIFEKITKLEEYYPTEAELTILEENKEEITNLVGPGAVLIEYGSGSSRKIKYLLSSFQQLKTYMPIDISKEFLFESAKALAEEYPKIPIKAICADYTEEFTLPTTGDAKKVVFFPGSTIGNFEPNQAHKFLTTTASRLSKGDGLLIGVDLKKDEEILHAAYNDKDGVTRLFNLNVLQRMNRELMANFKLEAFDHKAIYNAEEGRIEMHLVSLLDQQVKLNEEVFSFSKGETIHTENSYKYSIKEFNTLAKQSGFISKHVWTDKESKFSVHFLEI